MECRWSHTSTCDRVPRPQHRCRGARVAVGLRRSASLASLLGYVRGAEAGAPAAGGGADGVGQGSQAAGGEGEGAAAATAERAGTGATGARDGGVRSAEGAGRACAAGSGRAGCSRGCDAGRCGAQSGAAGEEEGTGRAKRARPDVAVPVGTGNLARRRMAHAVNIEMRSYVRLAKPVTTHHMLAWRGQ